MDGIGRNRRSSTDGELLRAVCCAIALCLSLASSVWAAESFRDDCESPDAVWGIDLGKATVTSRLHRRQTKVAHSGTSAEELLVTSTDAGREIAAICEVPKAIANDELNASLWVRSRSEGLQLAVGIVFPHQRDPRTGDLLKGELVGPRSTGLGDWEVLTCGTSSSAVSQLEGRIRSILSNRIDPKTLDFREAYVDRVALLIPTVPGAIEVQWDDLELNAIIAPSNIEQAAATNSDEPAEPQLTWADECLMREGRPFISRFVTYQGEPLDVLQNLGVNGVWVTQLDDVSLLSSLDAAGLSVLATPPPPVESDADAPASMVPFTREAAAVDCWMLGHVESSELSNVQTWVEQVRDADRRYARPVLADVGGDVKSFHRELTLLGASRHITHTSRSPADLEAFLKLRRMQALPGRPLCTILPTEASAALKSSRRSTEIDPVVEPEQIAMFSHIAAATGYKLFGFSVQTPLHEDAPGLAERRQMLKLINIELELLEPWLATGKILRSDNVRFGDAPRPAKPKKGLLNPFRSSADLSVDELGQNESPIHSTIMKSEAGLLLLVDWLEPNAQYQPGAMAARNLKISAPRYEDITRAWEVTTTDVRQISFDLNNVAGGVEIPLAHLDQHAAIVMTNDPSVIESLKRSVQAIRPIAAASWVELATEKLSRVEAVHLELQSLAPPVRNASASLEAARRALSQAEEALRTSRFDEARQSSQQVLELTRIVQRAYWNQATEPLSDAVASPHAICFQTLPDHWRLFNQLARNPPSGSNLLPSGTFEDESTVAAAGWRFLSGYLKPESGIRAAIALEHPSTSNVASAEGRYALQLAAAAARPEKPPLVEEPIITCLTPPIPVFSGQVVRITGKVLVPRELTGGQDGLMIYDTLMGSVGAQRFRSASPQGRWQSFEIYRDVKESTDFQVVFQLCGLGEAWIDDLQVLAVSLDQSPGDEKTPEGKPPLTTVSSPGK
jgi:hypothetical protein